MIAAFICSIYFYKTIAVVSANDCGIAMAEYLGRTKIINKLL